MLSIWLASVGVAYYLGTRKISNATESVRSSSTADRSSVSEPAKASVKVMGVGAATTSPTADQAVNAMMDSFKMPGITHLERIYRLITALRAMGPAEAMEARRQYEELRKSGHSVDYEENFIYWRLGEIAGRATLDEMKPSDPNSPVTGGLTRTMAAWAATAPVEATAWFNALPDGRFRDDMAFWVVDGVSQGNTNAGAKYFAGLPLDFQSKFLGNMLWLQSHNEGNAGTAAWFEQHVVTASIPEGNSAEEFASYRKQAFGEVVHRLTDEDPAKAAQWIETHQDPAYFNPREADRVYRHWQKQDPAAADAWSSRLGLVKPR
jgi:hypothetical protein